MSRRRRQLAGLVCVLLIVAAAAGEWGLWLRASRSSVSEKWELDASIACGEETGQRILKLLEEGVQVLCWKETKTTVLESAEYGRRVTTRSLGVVGDVSVLFPGSNYLPAGEQGSCLLGENTAIALFGTTRVTGCTVQLNGEEYFIAGIVYQEPDVCVYQLLLSEENTLTHAAVRANTRALLDTARRRLEMNLY